MCPFEVQLELAQRADAIVADYNYVFEPGVALRHLKDEDLQEAILVVDEAHNLPDRLRKIFSPELLEEELRALVNRLLLQPGELFADLTRTLEEVIEILEHAAEELPEGEAIAETSPPAERIHELRAEWEPKLARYLAWKRETRLALVDDPVLDAHFAMQRFAAVLESLWPGLHLRRRAAPDRHSPRRWSASIPRAPWRPSSRRPPRPSSCRPR